MLLNTGILKKEALYLSALSGGADSTALLLQLASAGYKVEAVHCNFHLRGTESDRDEDFCRQLCLKHGILIHVVHFDTTEYATSRHLSIETAARDLRYDYFFRLAADIGAMGVCVAHNMNDQAETLLMNIVRGAGIHGLTGMKEQTVHKVECGYDGAHHYTDVLLLRPMLNVRRSDIEDYLNSIGQDWVTDSTNLETDATRNKFRLRVFPMLEQINPAAVDNIARAARQLMEAERIYDSAIHHSIADVVSSTSSSDLRIDIKKLKAQPSPEPVLYEIVKRYGFNGRQAADIYNHIDTTSGAEWTSNSHSLVVDRGAILITELEVSDFSLRIPEEGNYRVGQNKHLKIERVEWNSDSKILKSPNTVCLDAKGIRLPLELRSCRAGDRFVPFGMKGSKLISDFLTDRKMSVIDKRRQLVLCDTNGNILWVVGIRPDNRFRIDSNTTEGLICQFD